MILDGRTQLPDTDPEETAEWVDSLQALVDTAGRNRARFVMERLLQRSRELSVGLPSMVTTDYINTITPEDEPWFPGDEAMERRIRRIVRWNAAIMVTRANKKVEGIGGHLSTYASSASLYEVGFNHFFRGKDDGRAGDQVFYQGHAAPGIYARAFLEGRFSEENLDNFRQETGGRGLSSYPHPRLMPDFWEFPTVSMGLGPLNAVYQARFNRYLLNRRIADTSDSRVWCFVGDGECDEPETLGALSIASRERLDNLVFIVNCNLQRLDGPVRGNGKVIQELEALFRGAGWHVIKVIWGREWDQLLQRDVDGVLVNKMNTTLDGEFQKYATETGAYIREHFFGPDPRLTRMVAHLSDDDLRKLRRGGHDYRKVFAAYKLATQQEGAPTVILAHTVKGWSLGPLFEGRNATHQIKKMGEEELRAFRDTLELPISDRQLAEGHTAPYYHPGPDSEEVEYLRVRRRALGGSIPRRHVVHRPLTVPAEKPYAEFLGGSGGRAASTTMVFAALLRNLLRDRELGQRIVPIIPDEARTFGMDALFREYKIYSPLGQRYEAVDANMVLSYTEATDGQILEEGITEAGSMASFTAAGTSYATHATPMVPFYIFYSMFGYQRVGDMVWAFGDARGRGFLLGATAGRTTLNGEGLQHQDGHGHLLYSAVPNVRAYDPAYAYELAVIIRDGLRRMYVDGDDAFYYITLYNENYAQPPMPDGAAEGIVRGIHLAHPAENGRLGADILASGTAVLAAVEAQRALAETHNVGARVWSVTSYQLLRDDGLDVERWNRLHPGAPPRVPYVTEVLGDRGEPVLAVSDGVKSIPDMIGRFAPQPFTVLGTDGYGRSDTRAALRRHFEVDAGHIVVGVLDALRRQGKVQASAVDAALEEYRIDPEAANPLVR